jgi:Gpi18-like mannosyltransferase
MTAVAGERTTRSRSQQIAATARRPFIAAVVIPCLVTRVLAIAILTVIGSTNGRPDSHQLLTWDGQWYQLIADHGYGPKPVSWPPGLGGWTKLPFFPLLPALWRGLVSLGFPHTVAVVVIGGAATFIAMWGTWRVAERHVPERVARHAVWLVGLLPGSLTFVMAYPDAIYLAGTVWAFLFVERRQYALAGVAAAVATAARPNGILVVLPLAVALVTAADLSRRAKATAWITVALPAGLFFASWCAFLWLWMGDPFAFFTAKAAWMEVSLWDYVHHPRDWNAGWNVLAGALAIALFVWHRRRQPVAWSVHAFLAVVPSLAIGVVGIVRYVSQCFVTPVALADLSSRSRRAETSTFALAVIALILYGYLITKRSYVP